MEYLFHVLVMVCIFTILSVSLDLLIGHTGLLSFAHAAFYGLGAYTSAILTVRFDVPFLIGVLAGIVVSIFVSLVVSIPSLRLHGDYFVISTFGFQMIIFSLLNNWMALTHGPHGIPGIPRPLILGWTPNSNTEFVLLTAGFATSAYLIVYRLCQAPFGRVLRAIREDEVFTQSLGKNTFQYKVSAFAVSVALAASAGSLYAHYVTFIDPTSFTVLESILVLSMVVIGGAGSLRGPVVGAVILITLPELLRFVGLPSATAANLRQMFYGTALVIMMAFRPQGLLGRLSLNR